MPQSTREAVIINLYMIQQGIESSIHATSVYVGLRTRCYSAYFEQKKGGAFISVIIYRDLFYVRLLTLKDAWILAPHMCFHSLWLKFVFFIYLYFIIIAS